MAPKTTMVTDVPNMQKTHIGAVDIITPSSNLMRCAVLVEVVKQKVTNNEEYLIFPDSLLNS